MEQTIERYEVTYPCGCRATGPQPLPDYCSEHTRDGWTPAAVGCHWMRGEYSISTYRLYADKRGTVLLDQGGYALYRHGAGEIGRYPTFEAAAEAAKL